MQREIPNNNFRLPAAWLLKAIASNRQSQRKGLKKMPMILLMMNMGNKKQAGQRPAWWIYQFLMIFRTAWYFLSLLVMVTT